MRLRTVGAAGGVGGAVAAALATGWIGAALLIVAIVVPIAAICWIVADRDRPQRLALLFTTWRHSTTAPTIRPKVTAVPSIAMTAW